MVTAAGKQHFWDFAGSDVFMITCIIEISLTPKLAAMLGTPYWPLYECEWLFWCGWRPLQGVLCFCSTVAAGFHSSVSCYTESVEVEENEDKVIDSRRFEITMVGGCFPFVPKKHILKVIRPWQCFMFTNDEEKKETTQTSMSLQGESKERTFNVRFTVNGFDPPLWTVMTRVSALRLV